MTKKDLMKELLEKGFLIKIKSFFFDEGEQEWKEQENYYLKVDGKIRIVKDKIEEVRFEIVKNDEESVIVRCDLKLDGRFSMGFAEVKKKIRSKKGELIDNIKVLEKAQSIAMGKALGYLGVGVEYGGLVTAEEIADATREAEGARSGEKKDNEVYVSEVSGVEIDKRVYDYSKKFYGIAMSYDEQQLYKELRDEGELEDGDSKEVKLKALKKAIEDSKKEPYQRNEELPF